MFKTSRGFTIIELLVVVAVIVMLAVKNPPADTTTENSTATEPESVQDISSQDTGATVTPISYANALVKYADRRIQLNTMCQAFPGSVTYKDNTGIMIDNRSPNTRTVKIGNTFTIKPWGFKIVILPDVYLKSKTILVDCDNSQNVATILVQE